MVCKRVGSWTLGRSLIVENLVEYPSAYGAIFVWPWHENALTKQEQQTNRNRAIWLAYRTDTNARGFWLVKRTLGWKNVIPENFLKINRYFALTSYCNTIGQSNNAFSILGFSLAGKRRGHVFYKTNNEHLPTPLFKVIQELLYLQISLCDFFGMWARILM